jgi:hypothetical protein
MDRQPATLRHRLTWLLAAILLPFAYVLSSGPVLATAFWLREATHWDGFYATMWLYYPLLLFGPDSLIASYIEWWSKLFGTVGPG